MQSLVFFIAHRAWARVVFDVVVMLFFPDGVFRPRVSRGKVF